MNTDAYLAIHVFLNNCRIFCEITDGLKVYSSGMVKLEQVGDLSARVVQAKSKSELLKIGSEFGLAQPLR